MLRRTFILLISLIALALGAFLGCGSDTEQTGSVQASAEAGHEGHHHGPGEHHEAPAPTGETNIALDWCREHRVPESQCTACNPALIAEFKATGDWCAGHGLPESHCRLCNPGITFPQEEVIALSAIDPVEDEIDVTLNFRPNAVACATDGALIQFASALTAERTGISVRSVSESRLEGAVDAPAEVVFDETAATVVTTTVPALVSRWMVSPGDVVRKGDVLAILQSPEIAELRAAFLSAQAEYDVQQKELERHRELRKVGLISAADYEQQDAITQRSRASLVGARGMLLSAGLDENDIDEIIKHGTLSNQFALRAGGAGMVVERIARIGELNDAGRAFALIADPSSMWIEARLTEEQLRQVSVGQTMTFDSDGRGLNRVGAEIIWTSRFLDPHTRTGTVRARVLDPNNQLRAGEFGRAHITRTLDNTVALVPKDAVQWEGCCNVVFVREAVDRYRPRKVELIDAEGPYYQVSGGLRPGEEVVVEGAFLLKTELKKTSIGAGCCGLEPVG
ncbi:MAG: efflux RND transporter periplasmic adaptor subunit [candidate division Zixibacteria bacterium]|jgi:cobalt-zinc-cadmium efflux system membrane fusion protein|nr:efflux RND transporter periplasmic adaptor subunit [candidate division Zixibacteria bacterium]